ncbi:MAG: DUF4325 domain-containing protein [Deltaproteobacteria bacterium]|nr:DUF4325 domain-containing protein [Deltaproteobacteria bacterium]
MRLTHDLDRCLRDLFREGKPVKTAQLVQRFKISRQALHPHLKRLIREGFILSFGTSRKTTFYALNSLAVIKKLWPDQKEFRKKYKRQGLKEDAVFEEISRQPFLLGSLSKGAKNSFQFAFTEMLNNAIDHSASRFVDVRAWSNPQNSSFEIDDHGIGIFENIRSKKKLGSEMEALQDLLKGKVTTQPERHSGEGIFFASKIADLFTIESHKKRLQCDNRLPDIFVSDIRQKQGTKVIFEIANHSRKNLADLFRAYTNEEFKFQKTRVTVKLFQEGETYVSRSQAKRLLHALDPFEEIILDFKGVETIGQGFADEIFRIYAGENQKKKVIPIHTGENVDFMIARAHPQKT